MLNEKQTVIRNNLLQIKTSIAIYRKLKTKSKRCFAHYKKTSEKQSPETNQIKGPFNQRPVIKI